MIKIKQIYEDRADYSEKQLQALRNCISSLPVLSEFDKLTIFGAGSFARNEASKYSDIDLFFLCNCRRKQVLDPHTRELRLFGELIEEIKKMGFPKFSNDCEYLKILYSPDMIGVMGKPADDQDNYFTVRMLLLLESKCLFGQDHYKAIIRKIIKSYYRDYPGHETNFQPIFLLNDICRFWKTLLMNYESKRGGSNYTEEQKTKHRVKNFKLKFSRMTTCFATIASICSYTAPVTEDKVIKQILLTPRQRLEAIPVRVPKAESEVQEVLDQYAFFLEKTGLPTHDLEDHFSNTESREKMFIIANQYGESMYRLLKTLDNAQKEKSKFLRYLVI